jgi:hypothetical protein
MTKLHITQDSDGFWMLSAEHPDGVMQLRAYHFVTPQHLLKDAQEMVADDGDYPGALVLIDPPRPAALAAAKVVPGGYQRPTPKRAGEQHGV